MEKRDDRAEIMLSFISQRYVPLMFTTPKEVSATSYHGVKIPQAEGGVEGVSSGPKLIFSLDKRPRGFKPLRRHLFAKAWFV